MSDAVERADAANKAATKAIADVKATEDKLYPVAENILKGTAKDTFIHVDDAFPSTLLGIEIEGATEQIVTTGKNLLNGCDAYFNEADTTYKSYLWGYTLGRNPLVLDKSIEPGTYTFSAYSTQGYNIYFAKKPYVSGQFVNFSCNKVVEGDTRFGLKRYCGTFTLTDTYELMGIYSENYRACFGGMIEKGSTATAYEPYTGGKPSPSPDFPQDIKVIENPTVKVAGRNLFDDKYPAYIAAYNNGVAIINKYSYDKPSIVLPFTTGPRSSNGFGFIEKLKPDVTYTLKAFNSPDKSVVCIAGYRNVEDIGNPSNAVWHLKETSLGGPVSFSVKEGGECVVFTFAAEWGDGTNKITYPADFKATIEHGSTATDYKPYTSQSQVFTLPAEHPYLAKLPDGTADEIMVDADGNVELVARVSKVIPKDIDTINFGAGTDTDAHYVSFRVSGIASKMGILCNGYQTSEWTNMSSYIYCPNGLDITIRDGRFTSKEKAIELLNGVVVYVAVEPTRYPLGKIEMPKAQDSIVNVWTDAEVTPRTGIEYTRDVNIVVANLESAIASIS